MNRRAATLAFAVLAALWLAATWPIDAIHFDSSRDLLMARDCYELGRCDGHGPPTSFMGLYQGVLWTNAVGLLRWLGQSPRALGYWLVGIYTLVLTATLRWPRAANLPHLAPLLLAGAVALMPVVLWSPTLFLPAMVLTTWLTLDWLDAPRWPLALALGVLWGVTLDLYLAAGPVLLATVALGLRARRPGQTLAIVLLTLSVGLLVSPGAWQGTWVFIPAHPLRVGAVVVTLAALIGIAVRAPRVDNVALLAIAGLGAWLIIGVERLFQSRYFMPGFPALALLVAQRLQAWPRARWLVVALTLAWATTRAAQPEPELSYSNAATLAAAMTEHHIGWPQALRHGQGPYGRQLAPATAIFLPHRDIQWLGADVVLDLTKLPQTRAVPSRIDVTGAELCRHTATTTRCALVPLDPTPADSVFPFAVRGYVSLIPPPPPEVLRLTLRLPVRPGARETLALLPQFKGDTCLWRFADGLGQHDLPQDVTRIELARSFQPGVCPEGRGSYDWFPPWLETPLEPAVAHAPPPPVRVMRQPVLPPSSQPRFSALAAQLGSPDPDIALRADSARVTWPTTQQSLELRYLAVAPWFQVVSLSADASHTAAVAHALPQVFTASPWQDADAPAAAARVAPEPIWPHLTLAALGLLVLLLAALRVAWPRPPR